MIEATRFYLLIAVVLIPLTFSMSSCSTTKYLKENEVLHQQTKIAFENPDSFEEKNQIKKDLLLISRPKPNNKLKLRFYNLMGGSKKGKGLWYWVGKKFGEPHRIYDNSKVARSLRQMENYMQNQGHFGATVGLDTLRKGKKIKVTYNIKSKGAYYINSIEIPGDSSDISKLVQSNQSNSTIKIGKQYNLTNLIAERNRLTEIARNRGFLYFNEDDIFFLADTTSENYKVDLYLHLKPKEDESYEKFNIGDTYIFTNYNLRAPNAQNTNPVMSKGGLYYSSSNNVIRQSVIDRLLPQRKGDLYSKTLENVSFSRLQALGIFKFVNVKYLQDSASVQNTVTRNIFLTPGNMQDITGSIELNSQTGNNYGTSAGLTYTHKNLFQRAERLNVSMTGELATQINSGASFINTSKIDFKVSYAIPKLIAPFRVKNSNSPFVPRTILSASVGYEDRAQFYSLLTSELKFGYKWQRSQEVQHEFNPISFNLFKLIDSTPEFDAIRAQNLRLSRSFDNVIIAGLKYVLTYSNFSTLQQKNAIYFAGELETSGNLLSLLSQISQKQGDEPFKLAGLPVSQYVKISADLRHYTNYRSSSLAMRIYTGVGVTYGNLQELPYSRQFTVGGANSLRAFQLRGLGPGSFATEDIGSEPLDNQFLDQTGNIKLEMNVEYRYPIISYLKGAVFLDAGNIWLIDNSDIPEGGFQFNRFMKEIAIGTGIGFRLDFNYFVIRLDTSFALRKPVSDTGFIWVLKDIDLFSRQWRKDNLTWHLAIGYPF